MNSAALSAELAALRASGLSLAQLAARTGLSVQAVWARLRRAGLLPGAPAVAPPPARPRRPCLRCQRPFASAGAHNRVCARCKSGRRVGVDGGLPEHHAHV